MVEMDPIANSAMSAPTSSADLKWVSYAELKARFSIAGSTQGVSQQSDCDLPESIELVLWPDVDS